MAAVAPATSAAARPESGAPAARAAEDDALRAGLEARTGGAAELGTADDGDITFIGGSTARPLQPASGAGLEAAGRAFVDQYSTLFGVADPTDDLEQIQAVDGAPGTGGAVRFQQSIDDVPVIAGQIVVQVGESGAVLSASGEASDVRGVDATPTISQEAATATAIGVTARASGVDPAALHASVVELAFYDPSLLDIDDALGARLVWHIEVRSEQADVDRYVLVDAREGAIALEFDQLAEALNRSVCDNANDISKAAICAPGSVVRTEGQPAVVDNLPAVEAADVNLAYDLSGVVYNFFFNRFGRDSLDGQGMPLISTVRHCETGYPCPFANAYWNGQQMVYGDNYATADDVVAHELTHGVTEFTSNLIYVGQSGALNESLSDIFGELVDLTDTTSGPDLPGDRWKVGEGLPIGAIRNMAAPTQNGDPDRIGSPSYYLGLGDNRGVHINSGVNNKAAALLTDGGTFNGQTVTGIGIDKAALIYYQLETTLLTKGSSFLDVFRALPQACTNLIGVGGITATDCDQARKVVVATEMDRRPGRGSAVPVCATGVRNSISFLDDMETDTANWDRTTSNGTVGPWLYSTAAWQSGRRSMRALDAIGPSGVSTLAMASSVAVPATGASFFRFEHSIDVDPDTNQANVYYDGGVVEYSIDGGVTWLDIAATAAPLPTVNGYSGRISTAGYPTSNDKNPLANRSAFGGYDSGFVTTVVDTSSLAGQNVRFRFRLAIDNYPVGEFPGWFVDDVALYGCGAPAAPGVPTAPTAEAAARSTKLTWMAPISDGGSPITSYLITPISNAVAQTPVSTGSATTSFTVPGLTPAANYTFTVAAVNAVGTGNASAASNTVTIPFVAPGTPTAVTAVAGDGAATVRWSAPADTGGYPISNYSIVASSNGVVRPPIVVGADTTYRITGLTNGVAYTFTVTATSPYGRSSASAPSAPVTPLAVVSVLPGRLLDTRVGAPTVDGLFSGLGLRSPGSVTPLTVLGRGGVAADAAAVVLNVTVTEAEGAGFVTVYPCGTERPNASSLNFVAGQTIPNLVVAKVDPGGQVCLYTHASAHLLVDVSGYFPPSAGLSPLVPARLLETRPGLTTVDGSSNGIGQRAAGTVTPLQVAGRAGIPADATAAILNVTATGPASAGFVTVFACGAQPPTASNLNYAPGQTIANAVVTKLGADGTVCLLTNAATDLIVDATGYFPAGSTLVPVDPARLVETRSTGTTIDGQAQGIGLRVAGSVTEIVVAGRGGVPAGATTAVLNVTVTETTAAGFATIYPCGTEPPTASNLNYGVGTTVANAVITRLGSGGKVCVFTQRATHLVADVDAYFAP